MSPDEYRKVEAELAGEHVGHRLQVEIEAERIVVNELCRIAEEDFDRGHGAS